MGFERALQHTEDVFDLVGMTLLLSIYSHTDVNDTIFEPPCLVD